MQNLIKILPLLLVTCACSGESETATGSEAVQTSAESGSGLLSIGENSSKLTVDLCHGPKTIHADGKDLTTYGINAAAPNIKVTISGFKGSDGDKKSEKAMYQIHVDGGEKGGGTTYIEDVPYAIFDGKKLHFKGVAQARTVDGLSRVKTPIEITVDC